MPRTRTFYFDQQKMELKSIKQLELGIVVVTFYLM